MRDDWWGDRLQRVARRLAEDYDPGQDAGPRDYLTDEELQKVSEHVDSDVQNEVDSLQECC